MPKPDDQLVMRVKVPRIRELTAIQQRAAVREILKSSGDYAGRPVFVQPYPKKGRRA